MAAAQEKVKKELILDGLDCANCALKIENGVKKIQGVSACSVNFVTKTLTMETTPDEAEAAIAEAKKKVHMLEPHIRIWEKGRVRPKIGASVPKHRVAGKQAREYQLQDQQHHHEHGEHTRHHSDEVMQAHEHKRLSPHHDDAHAGFNAQGSTRGEHKDAAGHGTHVHKQHTHQGHDHSHGGHEHDDHSHGDHDHAGHTHDHGSAGMRKLVVRLAVGAAITAAGLLAPVHGWAELAIFLIAYLVVGGDIVWQAARNIVRGQVFDEYFLMAVATIGAFAVQQYPEGVAVMLFYQLGELFQGIAVNRSRKSISELMDIRPDYANLKTEDGTQRVSPEEVGIGELIVVKPGEKVPLDGKVIEGASFVDTSALTGESVPREVAAGSDVLSGFINKNGLLTVEVTKNFGESTASKILDLVQNASGKKAPTEKFITKFARYYTPAVVIVALLLAVVPPLVLNGASFSDWIYRALIFLVISCPCALVVSIPLGFFGGIGAASKNGILVKGSNYLEALNNVKYVVFDKTGTLTKGAFQVTGIYPAPQIAAEQLLEYAAAAEQHSTHPIGESIRAAYGKPLEAGSLQQYNEISGHGIVTVWDGKQILAGNGKLMKLWQIAFSEPKAGGTIVHVAVEGRYAGYLVISDEVKEDAAQAIRSLKQLGIRKTVMLTGDVKAVGEAVAHKLGLDEVRAELLPQHKVEEIEKLDRQKSPKEKIVFVGDGINDTPVLARADIGAAMGGLGSDAAIEAADIVIMTDEPSKIATAIHIAKRTRTIVWQNIIFALGVKGIFLLFGAFGYATMWEAVFSDVGVTVIAVLNVMRVMRTKFA
ncbi:heavy metal translocating P-type ATPase [Paenibacillus thalictri]|uniref:Cd(2+)-exporting ATPase n=1 Tax=Paenibacillus thalictri TaxID=2527873 RepID=A0A4Q9DT64_9BACL|nr:heavy metal translocating P-type ATPase [Paenibacillus thalictri]TBL77668.1 cadmium-translocating P-type ATPase [Paenibacillus thalictri]